jgi:hypothetical protein
MAGRYLSWNHFDEFLLTTVSWRGRRAILMATLIGIFIVGVFAGPKALAGKFISSAERSSATNVVCIDVDDEATEKQTRLSDQVTQVLYSLFSKHVCVEIYPGNPRILFPKNLGAGGECNVTDRIGTFNRLQRSKYSIADILQFDVALNDCRVAGTHVCDNVPYLKGMAFGQYHQLANNDLGTVRRNELFGREVDTLPSELRLTTRHQRQHDCEYCDPNGSEGRYSSVIGLQAIDRLPEVAQETIPHRNLWFPICWLIGILGAPVLGMWLVVTS